MLKSGDFDKTCQEALLTITVNFQLVLKQKENWKGLEECEDDISI